MKKIYIMLSMSGTKFSRFLRALRPSFKYPHVSIALEEDLSTSYSFGRQNLTKWWIAGFVEEHPNTGVFGKFDPKCEILEIEVTDEQYEAIGELINEFKKRVKEYRYNYFGLVFSYFSVPRHLNNKFTCTQFVAWVLTNCNVNIVDKPTSLIYSTDYYKMPKCKLVYSGKLHEYKVNAHAV